MTRFQAAIQRQEQEREDSGFKKILANAWGRIEEVAPKEMNTDRLFQIALSALNKNPGLQKCTPATLLSCLMTCSALGLEPSEVDGLGRAYLVPRYNSKTRTQECTFILGYKGMIDLARRSDEIESISAHVVREGDVFRYNYGLNEDLYHVPKGSSNPITHVYMVAKFKGGGHHFEVMSADEVEKAKAQSQAKTPSSPWNMHYEAMACKTVIRRAFKYLPVSIESQRASAQDETTGQYSQDLVGLDFGVADAFKQTEEQAKEVEDVEQVEEYIAPESEVEHE